MIHGGGGLADAVVGTAVEILAAQDDTKREGVLAFRGSRPSTPRRSATRPPLREITGEVESRSLDVMTRRENTDLLAILGSMSSRIVKKSAPEMRRLRRWRAR